MAAQEMRQGDDHAGNWNHAEFQRLFAAGEYADALRRAQENVRIEEARHAASDELSAAYHDLGKAQLHAGSADAAVASLLRALQLLELTQSVASPRLMEPLTDLGEAYAALGMHDAAIEATQQAVAIGRRTQGLFNTEQMELLDRLAASFDALGNFDGVDSARRYAVLVAEKQFGPEHPDSLPAIGKLASWFELSGRYTMARDLYERTARIASREDGGRNVATVTALLGVARTHRLQYVETPELVEDSVWGDPPGEKFDPVTGQREAVAGAVERPGLDAAARLNRRGEDALLRSLEILNSISDPPRDMLARTLLEFGDWYQTDRNLARAISYYRRAWPLLEETSTAESPNPLLAPRPMFYRLPPKLRRNHAIRQENVVKQQQVEFVMTVSDRGEVSDVVRKGGDMLEGLGWQVERALNRATFSPRFVNGEPIATPGFAFIEFCCETTSEEQAASAAPAER